MNDCTLALTSSPGRHVGVCLAPDQARSPSARKAPKQARCARSTLAGFLVVLGCSTAAVSTGAAPATQAESADGFRSRFPSEERVWIGPDYWANRLQDWRVRDGRLECVAGWANKPMRTVHLVTRRLGPGDGDLEMSVRTGLLDPANRYEGVAYNAATGFLLGAGGPEMDYRSALLVHHNPGPGGGYFAGVDGSGQVFIRDFETPLEFGESTPPGADFPADRETPIYRGTLDDVTLRLSAQANGDLYQLTLTATDVRTGRALGEARRAIPKDAFVGNLALVSHSGGRQQSSRYWFRDWDSERREFEKWAGATARFWYRDWHVAGSKVEARPARAVGPVLSTQYTLSGRTLKLTAQLFPVGSRAPEDVVLEIQQDGTWVPVARAQVVIPGYTAPFRVDDWKHSVDVRYRVLYRGGGLEQAWEGTIRADPKPKDTVVLAAFTGNMMVRGGYEYPLPYGVDGPFPPELEGKPVTEGNAYLWNKRVYFPHLEVVENVRKQKPDLLFFSGDQVYEGNPTRAVERPLEEAHLDYLYKWYLWCWTWRDLTRDIPCVTIPDDHDVYQRNIWGDRGAFSPPGDLDGSYGGYFMAPAWINMIQRTQTSHLPDPVDPKPAKNGIDVYFTALTVGEIGFAVIEDRKFKSFPTVVDAEMSRDSHITQKNYDTREADVPGATLLGERQLRFLKAFAEDWRGQKMKAVLSQTIFCNLQILNPRRDGVPQEFDIPLDRDLDSNGWPQTGRRRALHEMRRGFMLHVAGDQHLASVIHHGTDEWEDAGWSLCVPSVANYYARSWNPPYPPLDHGPDMPPFTGRYEDGFQNKLTVKAVANPDRVPQPGAYPEPVELHSEVPGYGIVRFHKRERTMTLECWPRYADPSTGSMYDGWPVTVRQRDNYAREATATLPSLEVSGMTDPVVQVIDEAANEVVYTVRIRGDRFQPPVFQPGAYTVRVGDPDTERWQVLRHLKAVGTNDATLQIELR